MGCKPSKVGDVSPVKVKLDQIANQQSLDQSSPNKEPERKVVALVEQEDNFFCVDPEIIKLFTQGLETEVPSIFIERNWLHDPKEQHIADLYVITKMCDYLGKKDEFMDTLKEACRIENKKQLKSPDRPDYIKYRPTYMAAEDLFEKEASYIREKTQKDVKLEAVSGDTIGSNSGAFLRRRVDQAYQLRKDFEGYLRTMTNEAFGSQAEVVVNSKELNRVVEKVREMQTEQNKYPLPVENHLYDLLRAQIRLDPEELDSAYIDETMTKVKKFFNPLIENNKFIRIKNKLSDLGQISCNFIYENQIVELQIVFARSLASMKQSHIVYDLERLTDLTAVSTYLMKKRAVRYFLNLFSKLGMNAFDDQGTQSDVDGSLVFSHFIHFVFANPNATEYPRFPTKVTLKYKNLTRGKMVLDAEKKSFIGKAKVVFDNKVEYDGEWKNFQPNGNGKKTFTTGGKYEGEWKDGSRHGKGKYVGGGDWAGLVYNGDWINDCYDGQGKITYKNGDTYEGGFKVDKKSGKGKYAWAGELAGKVYDGEWKDDLYEGHGKITHKSGDCYEGEWKTGKYSGKGKYVWAGELKGQVYEGEYKDDAKEGQGKIVYKDGAYYDGQWKAGKKHGKGKYAWGGDLVGKIYDGEWKDDLYDGQGKMTFKDGAYYEGGFKAGLYGGRGKYVWAGGLTGQVYEGGYKDDCKDGQGKIVYKDGAYYDGQWQAGKKHGKGKYAWGGDSVGQIYEGDWVGDSKEGQGKLIYKSGDVYEGQWKADKKNGKGKYAWGGDFVGQKYEGEYKDGLRHGQGTTVYKSGNSDKGIWENDKFIKAN